MGRFTDPVSPRKIKTSKEAMEELGITCAVLGEARSNLSTLTSVLAYRQDPEGFAIGAPATRDLIAKVILQNIEVMANATGHLLK